MLAFLFAQGGANGSLVSAPGFRGAAAPGFLAVSLGMSLLAEAAFASTIVRPYGRHCRSLGFVGRVIASSVCEMWSEQADIR